MGQLLCVVHKKISAFVNLTFWRGGGGKSGMREKQMSSQIAAGQNVLRRLYFVGCCKHWNLL